MTEESIRSLPIWKGPIQVEPLSGGITNLNYRVVDGDDEFAVRTGVDDPALGISRSNELTCTRVAAALGIAPRVAYSAPGVLVSEFVSSSTPLTPQLLSEPDRISRAAAAIRDIHDAGPVIGGHLMYFSPFQVTRTYIGFARDNDLVLPIDDADRLTREIQEMQDGIGPFKPTFCHNDMMPGNFLDTGDRLWIIDWEYSGIGHGLFDLAGLSSNCEFDDEKDRLLLEAYSRSDPIPDNREFRIMKAMAALRESLWAVVQGSQSEIEFDYDGYRDDNFDKYRAFRRAALA